MRASWIAVLLVACLGAACARKQGRVTLHVPAAPSDERPRSAFGAASARPAQAVDAAANPEIGDAGVATHAAPAPEPSTPPAGDAATDDPWIGMTEADVRRVVKKTHPTLHLNGDATLTIRGATWTIEFEPGNCSDRTTKIELLFERRRVAHVTRSRGPSTGKICDW